MEIKTTSLFLLVLEQQKCLFCNEEDEILRNKNQITNIIINK